jgi:hypothetical protein
MKLSEMSKMGNHLLSEIVTSKTNLYLRGSHNNLSNNSLQEKI